MVDKAWLEGYDPVAAGEQSEDGTDLIGIRHNLTLTVAERIERRRRAAASLLWLQKPRHAPRSPDHRPSS